MHRFSTIDEVRAWRRARFADGAPVALTPTMGALHAGHLAHITTLRERTDTVICSVFVNPTQFAPDEDFGTYPRTLDRDATLLREAGCTALFAPTADEMYRGDFSTSVIVSGVTEQFEGEHRPDHFRGVTTVVAKLLCIVQPDLVSFGQKDAQQLAVVRRMVDDLEIPTEVVPIPIVRDPDGLAMSSRNAFLSDADRAVGLMLRQALIAGREVWTGTRDRLRVEAVMSNVLRPTDRIDYATVVDADRFVHADRATESPLGVVAAVVGRVRLIDNLDFSDVDSP